MVSDHQVGFKEQEGGKQKIFNWKLGAKDKKGRAHAWGGGRGKVILGLS